MLSILDSKHDSDAESTKMDGLYGKLIGSLIKSEEEPMTQIQSDKEGVYREYDLAALFVKHEAELKEIIDKHEKGGENAGDLRNQ